MLEVEPRKKKLLPALWSPKHPRTCLQTGRGVSPSSRVRAATFTSTDRDERRKEAYVIDVVHRGGTGGEDRLLSKAYESLAFGTKTTARGNVRAPLQRVEGVIEQGIASRASALEWPGDGVEREAIGYPVGYSIGRSVG